MKRLKSGNVDLTHLLYSNVTFVPKIHEYLYISACIYNVHTYYIYTNENLYLQSQKKDNWHVNYKDVEQQTKVI